MVDMILDGLNEKQKEAAMVVDNPLLILAGAGSGKTKTITTRLAYLISCGIPADNTLTLTFTNKAANEMKSRAYAMLNKLNITKFKEPLLCTFHHFGLMVLKRYIHLLGYKSDFLIIDTADRKKIIKDILKDYNDKDFGFYSRYIQDVKNELISEEEQEKQALISDKQKIAHKVNLQYNSILKANNYLDFDDLLFLTWKILKTYDDVKNALSIEYQYITVDEYQDTNKVQFEILMLLCSTHRNLCVVGDEDQCIYSFRGSKIDNILNFSKQFNDAKVIYLEENYRCSSHILDMANKVIANNTQRLGKKLFTQIKKDNHTKITSYSNAYDEAEGVISSIKSLLSSGVKPNDIVILYRLNSLSMLFEEELMKNGIAYTIVGSLSFYERMEIKDVVAYLRLIHNIDDDISFSRIINTPKRGLGDAFLNKLKSIAYEKNISLFKALDFIDASKKQAANINEFKQIINKARQNNDMHEIIKIMNTDLDISSAYVGLDNYDEKCSNIVTFFSSLKDKANNSSLGDILNELTLYDPHSKATKESEIYLMSIHASKGLEFENVFIVGMEEDIFPAKMNGNIEEERRLCYVAFTRAKTRLYVSYAGFRMGMPKIKSRFISEACGNDFYDDLNDFKNEQNNTNDDFNQRFFSDDKIEFEKGDRVKHKLFGVGRVIEVNKDRAFTKLKINFAGSIKDIISDYVDKI